MRSIEGTMPNWTPQEIAQQILRILKLGGQPCEPYHFRASDGWTQEQYDAGLKLALSKGWVELPRPNELKLTDAGRLEGISMPASSFESFAVDWHTASMLAQLQEKFGVRTNAEVLRRAVALASVVSQYAGTDNTITITPDGGKPPVKIYLAE